MPKKGNIGRPKQVPLKRLQKKATERGAVRSGSTADIQRRAREYERQLYSGDIYYSTTQNMKAAEDKLLQAGPGRHNVQKTSGAQSKPGTAYVVQGKKYSGKKRGGGKK